MKWSGGLSEWNEGGTTFISVVFTWRLDEAYSRALFARACGLKVRAGGPALFLVKNKHVLVDVAEIGGDYPDAIVRHNPSATYASTGCSVGCGFCIVTAMTGRVQTPLPDFPVRPILCDNNLSALPADYQDYIIRRYRDEGVRLLDANSGFEPRTFDEEVYRRWRPLVNAGGGPWRFACDDMAELPLAQACMRMLKDEPQRRKRVYVMIANEPYAESMARIQAVIDGGCEPHVQPYLSLVQLDREPRARFDMSAQKQKDIARWANGFVWKRAPFEEYDRYRHSARGERYNEQAGMFE